MAALDYYAIQQALADMLQANVTGVKSVFIEGMEREVGMLTNMPLLNVRLTESSEELVNIPDGVYERMMFQVDVITFDLSLFREAAKLRDDLLKAAKEACRSNRRFVVGIETSSVQGQTTFGAAGVEGGQGHIAMATFSVLVEAYVNT